MDRGASVHERPIAYDLGMLGTDRFRKYASLYATFCALVLLVTSGCGDDGSESSKTSGSSGSTGTTTAKRVLTPLEKAAELEEGGRFGEATKALENIAESQNGKERAKTLVRAGEIYLASRRFQPALRVADRAIETDATSADAHWLRGESLREDKRVEEARKSLDEALRLTPGHLRSRLSLARLRFRVEDPAATLPHFEAFLEGGKDPRLLLAARLEYGRALRGAKRYQDAADQFAMLLEENPTESEYYSELSRTLYRLRRRAEAKFVEGIYKAQSQLGFEEYGAEKLKTQGRDVLALTQAAIVADRHKKPRKAYEFYRKSMAANSGDSRVAIKFAGFLLRFHRAFEARDVAVVAIDQGWAPASGLWAVRGRAELELEDWKSASASLERALKELAREESRGDVRGPAFGQALTTTTALALIYVQLEGDDVVSAKQNCERFRERDPNAWESWFWLGRLAYKAGEIEEAQRLFGQAFGLARHANQAIPADIVLWHSAMLARRGEPKGIERLERLLEDHPLNLEFWEILSQASTAGTEAETRYQANAANASRLEAKIDDLHDKLESTAFADSGEIYFELAGALREAKKVGIASEMLLLASGLAPESAKITKAVIPLVRRKDDIFVRLRFLRRLVDLEPDSVSAMHDLAEIYTKLHIRLAEAERLGERLHAREASEKSYVIRVRAASLLGKTEKAVTIAREGLAEFPGSAELGKFASDAK